MVLPGCCLVPPFVPPSCPPYRRPQFGKRARVGARIVQAAVSCTSFIYIWHLHNEAGNQWQPLLAEDRVACLQF